MRDIFFEPLCEFGANNKPQKKQYIFAFYGSNWGQLATLQVGPRPFPQNTAETKRKRTGEKKEAKNNFRGFFLFLFLQNDSQHHLQILN